MDCPIWFIYTPNGVFTWYCRAIAAWFLQQVGLITASSTCCCHKFLTVQTQLIQHYTARPPLFLNRGMMISFSQPWHTLHTFLSLHTALCTNKPLYANFPHPSYRDIQHLMLSKQAMHFSVMFFSFLISFFTAPFVLRGIVFSWQVLLYLLIRIAEALIK